MSSGSSRRSLRRLLVAVLLGVMVGGGLMAVTPAGAEVSQSLATSWKKIWKKELKPLADKRYYKKSQSDAKYQVKGSYETAGSGYTKAESDAKYAGAGSAYSKGESDGRYARVPALIRGGWAAGGYTGGSGVLESSFSFGVTLSAPPIDHFIPFGSPVPAGCSGSLAAPNADPGHLCVFEQSSGGMETRYLCNLAGLCNSGVAAFGASVFASDAAGGADRWMRGTWALRPGGASTVVPTGTTSVPPAPNVPGPTEAGARILR